MHCTTRSLLTPLVTAPRAGPAAVLHVPAFLAPALQSTSFSTTAAAQKARQSRRGNPGRAVSALYRSGPARKQPLPGVKVENLPRPVLDASQRSVVDVDSDHGLWDFFPADRVTMATPAELHAHGRSWTLPELRNKDWDDLHRLWWVCLKELNRLNTYSSERDRVGNMYGAYESEGREQEVKRTMKGIKHTLTERWYTWENARADAMEDDEINMYANLDGGDIAYLPKAQDVPEPEAGNASSNDTLAPPLNEVRPPRSEARV